MSNPAQCNAITASGTRCTRSKHPLHKGYCAQHATKAEGEKCSDPTTVAVPVAVSSIPKPVAPASSVGTATTCLSPSNGGQHRTPSPADNYPTVPVAAPLPVTGTAAASKPSLLEGKIAPRLVDDSPHLIVEAMAGTGKTTTLIEGLKRIKGCPTPGFVPSPQQKAVFDAMEMSKGKVSSICFVAFNTAIAAELKSRVPQGCEASTMHGMGFKAVNRNFKLNNASAVNKDRVQKIVEELTGIDVWELRRKNPVLLQSTQKLVDLCKMNLTDADDVDAIDALASHYEIDIEDDDVRDEVYDLVPRVLERCKDVTRDGFIDFCDMIWLPIVLNLPMPKYDLLLVDECQDLSRCQQALAIKAGKRLICVGDPKQAIYAFCGADSDSMPRMARELGNILCEMCSTPVQGKFSAFIRCSKCGSDCFTQTLGRGCVTLPLTVTRRCGKAIVREAQKLVPDFSAHESNGEGKVSFANYPTNKHGKEMPLPHYTSQVNDGDMVLCRMNAPLVSQCFRFLKAGRKASIQGRDVGQGLVSLVKRLGKSNSVVDLTKAIDDWSSKEVAKEQAKKFPSEARLFTISDLSDCLHCFTEGCNTVDEIVRKIDSVFTDSKKQPGILLSSIHKAKGLESQRVFLLQPDFAPVMHPMTKTDWGREQNSNLLYVAITRSIKELIHVS